MRESNVIMFVLYFGLTNALRYTIGVLTNVRTRLLLIVLYGEKSCLAIRNFLGYDSAEIPYVTGKSVSYMSR